MNLKKFYLFVRQFLAKIAKQNASPHIIALSFAIGSFIAILPLFGLGIPIALAVAFSYKKLNKIAIMSSFVLWSPLLVVPLMTLSYQIGDWFFGSAEVVKYNFNILNYILTFSRRFLIGHSILTVIGSVLSYFLMRIAINYYYQRKKNKGKTIK